MRICGSRRLRSVISFGSSEYGRFSPAKVLQYVLNEVDFPPVYTISPLKLSGFHPLRGIGAIAEGVCRVNDNMFSSVPLSFGPAHPALSTYRKMFCFVVPLRNVTVAFLTLKSFLC